MPEVKKTERKSPRDASAARAAEPAEAGKNAPLAAAAEGAQKGGENSRALFFFSRGGARFALEPSFVGEITRMAAVHRLPHRRGGAIVGVSNINGDLVLVVDIKKALKLEGASKPPSLCVLCRAGGEKFAFGADEIEGSRRVPKAEAADCFDESMPFVCGKIAAKGGAEASVIDAELMANAIIRRLV